LAVAPFGAAVFCWQSAGDDDGLVRVPEAKFSRARVRRLSGNGVQTFFIASAYFRDITVAA